MTNTYNDEPQSLTEEAKQQGIEIQETLTEQVSVSDNTNANNQEETEESNVDNSQEQAPESEGVGDDYDDDSGDEDEDTLQEEVESHERAMKAVEDTLAKKGVDFNSAIEEYQEKGSLSQKTVEELVKAGYPVEVIESFVEGRRALEARFTDAVLQAAGGEQEYQRVTSWAAKNLPQQTVEAFNRAIDGNNLEAVKLMVEGMKSKMTSKMGTAKKSIHGGASAPTANRTEGFATKGDIVKAMSDKRYGIDPEYTRAVEKRMWATNL